LANDSGGLIERYTYDLAGRSFFFDSTSQPLNTSTFNNRFLFQGRDYSSELGLYDYRNRIYFPGWGRFLQPDPLGFGGGDANLFRFCGGDPVNRGDLYGLTSPDPTKKNEAIQPGYWGTPAGQAELASMPTTASIDVHTTELPSGNRDINSLDRSGAAPGERSTGGGGGREGTLYAQNARAPRGNTGRNNRSDPPVWRPGNPNVPTQPWEIEPYEPPHDVDQLDGDIAAQSLKDIFNLLFGWVGDIFQNLPPYTPSPQPMPSVPYAPQPSPSGPPTPSPGGGG
jgi:RHS repeat-associated protein